MEVATYEWFDQWSNWFKQEIGQVSLAMCNVHVTTLACGIKRLYELSKYY